LEYSQLKEDLR